MTTPTLPPAVEARLDAYGALVEAEVARLHSALQSVSDARSPGESGLVEAWRRLVHDALGGREGGCRCPHCEAPLDRWERVCREIEAKGMGEP